MKMKGARASSAPLAQPGAARPARSAGCVGSYILEPRSKKLHVSAAPILCGKPPRLLLRPTHTNKQMLRQTKEICSIGTATGCPQAGRLPAWSLWWVCWGGEAISPSWPRREGGFPSLLLVCLLKFKQLKFQPRHAAVRGNAQMVGDRAWRGASAHPRPGQGDYSSPPALEAGERAPRTQSV